MQLARSLLSIESSRLSEQQAIEAIVSTLRQMSSADIVSRLQQRARGDPAQQRVVDEYLLSLQRYKPSAPPIAISARAMGGEFFHLAKSCLYARQIGAKQVPIVLRALPLQLQPQHTNPAQPQLAKRGQFAPMRRRLYSAALGEATVIEHAIGLNADIVQEIITSELPPDAFQGNPEETLRWILGEESGAPLTWTHSAQLNFCLLTLRFLGRMETGSADAVTEAEMVAIIRHVLDRQQPTVNTVVPNARVIHVATMYEHALLLTADANAVAGSPYDAPLLSPSELIDGSRLTQALSVLTGQETLETLELEGTLLPHLLPGVEVRALLGSISRVALDCSAAKPPVGSACRFGVTCRWLKCPLNHPASVWGLCAFDGSYVRFASCPYRHRQQDTPVTPPRCTHDGRCYRDSCMFSHVLQQGPLPKPARHEVNQPLDVECEVLREHGMFADLPRGRSRKQCRFGQNCRNGKACWFDHDRPC